jgi:hypothetical protein
VLSASSKVLVTRQKKEDQQQDIIYLSIYCRHNAGTSCSMTVHQNDRKISEQQRGTMWKHGDHGLIRFTIPVFTWKDCIKPRRTLDSIARMWFRFATWALPNTSKCALRIRPRISLLPLWLQQRTYIKDVHPTRPLGSSRRR